MPRDSLRRLFDRHALGVAAKHHANFIRSTQFIGPEIDSIDDILDGLEDGTLEFGDDEIDGEEP